MRSLDRFNKKMSLSGGSLREESIFNTKELLKTASENNFADNRATSIDKSLLVGVFVNGAIRETDGGLITNDYAYRVASSEYFVFSTDIVLYIANGFNARVAFYNSNDELTGMSNLLYNIPLGIAKNTKFRITIKRDVENTAEIANISEFRSAVTYLTNTTKYIIPNKDSVKYLVIIKDTVKD